jgi:hypothetical protein
MGCGGFKWPRIASNGKFCGHDNEIVGYVKVKTKKKSCFLPPCRPPRGEEVQLLLIPDLGTR